METKPEFYEGQLSQQSKEARELVEKELSELYASVDDLVGIPRIKVLNRIDNLEETLSWQGANPKVIDFEALRDHIRSGKPELDSVEKKYVERINNRATAIRAFCVQCQGGVVIAVKECPSVTCPLHPYRMGIGDPFRGFELPKPQYEPELPDDEEEIGEFEDSDDD